MNKFYNNLKLIKKGLDVQYFSLLDKTTTTNTKDYNECIEACENVVCKVNLYLRILNYFKDEMTFDALIETEFYEAMTVYDLIKLVDEKNVIDLYFSVHEFEQRKFYIIDFKYC